MRTQNESVHLECSGGLGDRRPKPFLFPFGLTWESRPVTFCSALVGRIVWVQLIGPIVLGCLVGGVVGVQLIGSLIVGAGGIVLLAHRYLLYGPVRKNGAFTTPTLFM